MLQHAAKQFGSGAFRRLTATHCNTLQHAVTQFGSRSFGRWAVLLPQRSSAAQPQIWYTASDAATRTL